MNKSEFYIPSAHSEAVVLKINGDELICAPLIVGTFYFRQEYFVLNINDKNLSITAQAFTDLRAYGKNY